MSKWISAVGQPEPEGEQLCSICGLSWEGREGILNEETGEYICDECESWCDDEALDNLAKEHRSEYDNYFEEAIARIKEGHNWLRAERQKASITNAEDPSALPDEDRATEKGTHDHDTFTEEADR